MLRSTARIPISSITKLILALLFVAMTSVLYAQSLNITDPDYDQNGPLDCAIYNDGSMPNFYDDGGSGANYSANFGDTIVFCPDLTNGSKVSISFGVNSGFSWDVDSTDTVYIWDGPDVNSPFLGAHNSATDPLGFSYQASFVNNPSGCLTVAFVSDSLIDGTGWEAVVTCGNPAQPFDLHMQGYVNDLNGDTISPADTGIIQLCLGDSILYIADAVFPYSLENTGTGYSQVDSNMTYQWFFSNGQILTGDSVWFTPPDHAGYVVTLQVTDQFPSTQQLISYIRVNPKISFSGTRALNDSICPGDSVQLIAGISPNDTVGLSPTVAETELGGSFAGLTYLPDGSGVNYETDINITGFGTTQTITSANDLLKMTVNIEHSFLGDLEMMLTCPNGDSVIIFNSYTGQGIGPAFAGGFGGGGIYLGDALDNSIQNPGEGWTYEFSDVLATYNTMGVELANGTITPTIISLGSAMDTLGIYLPEQSFGDLTGCPINGTWTLTVRDNLSIDDGYIFDWAIFFDPAINPNSDSYTSSLVSATWLNANGDTLGNPGDTTVTVSLTSPGSHYYTMEVVDDFGCTSDTTIHVFLTERTIPLVLDTGICEDELDLGVLGADSAFWSALNDTVGNVSFLPNATDTFVTAQLANTGSYVINLTSYKNNCVFNDSVDVVYFMDLQGDLIRDTLGCFDSAIVLVPNTDVLNATYNWMPGGDTTKELVVTESGTYFLTVTGCQTASDSSEVIFYEASTILANALVCDSLDSVQLDKPSLGGTWLALESLSDQSFSLTTTETEAEIYANGRGYVAIAYLDSLCASVDTSYILFEHFPSVSILDSFICAKDIPLTLRTSSYPSTNLDFQWFSGEFDDSIQVFTPGVYELNVINACGTAYDSVHVAFQECDFYVPNVITPNQDGWNDVFSIPNAQYYERVELEIYNRWGLQVYSGIGENATWDGRNKNGELMSDGVYFFVARLDGEESLGSLTLMRD